MKNTILSLLSLIAIMLSVQSCKEDIELIGEFEETAVVYGILDQSEDVHMIKITRAFIGDGSVDNNSIASIPDSSYFANVTGTVTEFINNSPARVFTLSDTVVTNKEQNGIFYAPEQKLYYFKTSSSSPLLGNATYRLDLSINDGAFEVSAETELVDGITENISGKNTPFNFINSQDEYISSLITLNSTGNSHQVNTSLLVEFTEWVGSTPTVKSFRWSVGESQVTPFETHTFSVAGESFYNLMVANCSSDNNIDKRTLNSITTIITAGAEDLSKFISINQPSSSLAQSKPEFTNLTATKGHKIIGVFSARKTIEIFDPFIDPSLNSYISALSKRSRKSLCIGSITSGYLFCSDHPGDFSPNIETYYCN